jgi:hypothetical protein
VRRFPLLLVVLGSLAVGGCSSGPPATLVESDVPLPPEMDVRFASEIDRSGGTLMGGRFLLSGDVRTLKATVDETVLRFSSNGWTEAERTISAERAALLFRKDDRTVRVEIDRRRIDPGMSTALVLVGSGDPIAGSGD